MKADRRWILAFLVCYWSAIALIMFWELDVLALCVDWSHHHYTATIASWLVACGVVMTGLSSCAAFWLASKPRE